jgi:hypothetical protein
MSALCIAAPESSLLPTLTGAENALSPDSQKWPAHRRLAERASLPTLVASDSKRGFLNESPTRKGGPSLMEAIGDKLLPTLWAKQSGSQRRGKGSIARGGGESTIQAVERLLPTLTASRYGSTNNGTRDGEKEYATKGTPSLDSLAGSALSPKWCSWFMGAPEGWMDVDHYQHEDLPLFSLKTT